MIDLHSHILPGIDDGSDSLDTSLHMLDAALAIGCRTIIATPHLTDRLACDYESAVGAAFHQVAALGAARGIELRRGFEIRLSPGVPARLRAGDAITLDGTNSVLVDLPFGDWPNFVDSTLFDIQVSGFQPILAHPERYPRIQRDPRLGLELAERGVALQTTISSYTGIFGRPARRAAESLLALGAVHLVATDAHSAGHRMAAVPAGLARLEALVGADGLHRLTTETPATLLNGDPLPAPVRSRPRSRWARLPLLGRS